MKKIYCVLIALTSLHAYSQDTTIKFIAAHKSNVSELPERPKFNLTIVNKSNKDIVFPAELVVSAVEMNEANVFAEVKYLNKKLPKFKVLNCHIDFTDLHPETLILKPGQTHSALIYINCSSFSTKGTYKVRFIFNKQVTNISAQTDWITFKVL